MAQGTTIGEPRAEADKQPAQCQPPEADTGYERPGRCQGDRVDNGARDQAEAQHKSPVAFPEVSLILEVRRLREPGERRGEEALCVA